ncbi:helix-turn-helix transcriptional regulator, GntR family [Citrifermentans bemidjiense Bem]|jgi:GntR family transcriptional repressor for pyruvate dehydrogenase complex|uniref:Pyruvate dehydrogenase complex repressor n=1 Tax=Citrifermentans bemidjiense (strain ATCC BAA-1014 / DSM 16622 / JCM 12645 / Bem) TaxID=404380 RepID=B5EIV2_CITBB|nr:FadR/GntR family transcriptional regulator [Citrifermentans bemidjiense]ACH39907.1 helix-turn-helix transcriptional regulator, GntR family [Citrifermentans bemidjiense Bem]
MKFTPIKPKKVSTQIAEQIRSSILAGEFNPGEKLPPERELAELFGVSRPSVREALNILTSSGLVETYQGGGTLVRSLVENSAGMPLSELIRIDGDRALDVIEVRKGMESWTAWYAATRALPEDVRRLQVVVDGMAKNLEQLKASEDFDAHFHMLVARATHNVVWGHMMQSIFEAMQEFQRDVWRAVYMTEEDQRLLFSHHLKIYEMIRDRDADGARVAMLEHLDFAQKRCSAYVSMRGTE